MQKTVLMEAEKIGYRIGNKYVLKDINWCIGQGEHWLLFGLNGSGKTTLLTAMAGYGTYSEGVLTVFGDRYTDDNVIAKRKQIGFVSSSFFDRVYTSESVWDIVLSGLTGTLTIDMNISDYDRKRAIKLLKALDIAEKRRMPYSNLSKGQRQNVLIARALIGKPRILILDEPCTGLDVFNRELLLGTVKDLAQNTDMTILYVTHYTEEILPEFDQCVLLKNGHVYKTGATKKLFNCEIISEFVGYPVRIVSENNKIDLALDVISDIRGAMDF